MRPCIKCNEAIGEYDNFCPACGTIQNLNMAPANSTANPTSTGMKRCPYCAEEIKTEAVVCRYCGKSLLAPKKDSLGCGWALLAFAIPIVGFIVGLVYLGQADNHNKGRDMIVVSVIGFIIGFIVIMMSNG